MRASMVADVSSNLSPLSVQEKGSRNKRKFRAEQPLNDPSKVLPSILNDGLSYEFSADKFVMNLSEEKLLSPCDVCGVPEDHLDSLKLDLGLSSSAMAGSVKVNTSCPGEVEEASELHDADWGDLTEGQLEVLVLSNLDMIFKGAIKKIMACGYTEEFANEAILRSGLCYGSKDTLSNVVDNALVFLRNEQDVDPSSEHCFEDLQQLAKYVLAELVCVLREVRPFFSTGDAMWCLLICDMNLSHACAMDRDPLSSLIIDGSSNGDISSTVSPQSKVETESDDRSIPDPSKKNRTFHCTHVNGGFTERINLVTGEREGFALVPSCNPKVRPFCAVGISQMEEKNVSSRKAHSSSSKIPRQKSLHLEKGHRGNGTKGTFRAAKFSGFILDKRYKSTSESSGLNLKSASLKISKAMAMGVQLAQEHGAFNFLTTSPLFKIDTLNNVSTSRKTDHTPAAPLVETIPVADTELSLSLDSLPLKRNTCQVNMSCNVEAPSPGAVGLPYDSPSAQWLPRDEKDDMIIKLIPRARELHNQLQEWTEWANQKVMQAARRLSKDKVELKALRQEKEEVERLKKEKQSFEDNTMKKLSEMEIALAKASGQVARANVDVRRLEVENAALRREMEVAKLQAAESAASCQELSKREKKIFTKFQSWEKHKCIFLEELAAKRRQLSQLQQELEQAKDLRSQLEARWKQEEKAKEEVLAQANSISKEREQHETSVKRKEETVRMKAETNLEKYKQDVKELEKQISQLRLKIDSSKIEALKRGINGGILSDSEMGLASKGSRDPFMENRSQFFSPDGVKRERECVMCLSEEMSVVFLPCAHQVVCKMCNELHEKQGMNDCPSCRSPIVRRVSVRYVRP